MSYLPNMSIVMDSFGWAVLHSFWQGALAAIVVWIVRASTKERASEGRYVFGFSILCALLCAFIGTFLYYYNAANISGMPNASAAASNVIDMTYNAPLAGNVAVSPFSKITQFTDVIGLLWLSCFGLLGLRYLAAFRHIHQLRTTGHTKLPSNWQARFDALAATSGVSAKVRGLVSAHVASPITFGFWRPVILVPTWFFTGMSAQQCEAILLHELAHIRRHDYICNILQIVIKTVFFYHPAVQYISKMVDTDREHACDDFAVQFTNCPENLATALGLVRLKAAHSGGVLALAADGPDTPLMYRLKRLVGTPTRQVGHGSARSAAATIIAISTATAMFTLGASNSQAHPTKQEDALLAGAPPNDANNNNERRTFIANGGVPNEVITVHGKTYKTGTSDLSYMEDLARTYTDAGEKYHLINGKRYSSKYTYNLYSRDGQTYVAKQKGDKHYIEIDGSWHKIGSAGKAKLKYSYSQHMIDGQSYKTKTNTAKNQTFIKIRGHWYDIDEVDLDALIPAHEMPMPPAHPQAPEAPLTTHAETNGQSYWRNPQDREAAQMRIEQANEHREAALERAQEQREREWERAEAHREAAWERTEEQRERAQERRERAQEQRVRQQEQRVRSQEKKMRERERDAHKREAKQDAKQAADYEQMRARLIPALTADGYLSPQQTKVTIDMTSDDIFVNGK